METIIIGHGPSLNGKGLGKYIDSHSIVIRLTTYLNFQNPEDYGNKTSYHFTYSQYARYIKYDLDHYWRQQRGSCEIPIETWIQIGGDSNPNPKTFEEVKRSMYERFPDYKIILFQEFFEEVRKEYIKLNPEFIANSSAFSATVLAIDRLKPKIIKLMGCDNLYQGSNENYVGAGAFPSQQEPRKTNHDFAKEKQFLTNYATKKGVTLIWEMLR